MIIDEELQTFLAGGVSITVTTRSRDNVPSLARAKGCRILAGDPARLRIFVSATQAEEVLRDLKEIGAVSVAFSQPQTHRAFQFKGRDARIDPVVPEDRAVRTFSQSTQRWNELSELLDGALTEIEKLFGLSHSMIHWLDESQERVYLVASRGYEHSGVGSEVQLGQGVIGMAARARTSIRVTHATSEYTGRRALERRMHERVFVTEVRRRCGRP